MRQVTGLALLIALAPLTASGCRSSQPEPVDFSETARNFLPRDYEDIYDRWTRHGRVVSGEGLEIEIWATLKSWEYRAAYVERYTDLYHQTAEEKSALRANELEASQTMYELHVAVQTNDHRSNDLDDADSVWRVVLVDGAGDVLEPEGVSRQSGIMLTNYPRAYETAFFPFRTAFTISYVMQFPRTGDSAFGGPETGQIALRIAGPRATVEVEWDAR